MIKVEDFNPELHEIVLKSDLKDLLDKDSELMEDLQKYNAVFDGIKGLIAPGKGASMMSIIPAVTKLMADDSFKQKIAEVVPLLEKYSETNSQEPETGSTLNEF